MSDCRIIMYSDDWQSMSIQISITGSCHWKIGVSANEE